MSLEKSNLKDILSTFVDSLVDEELGKIKDDLVQMQKDMRADLTMFKKGILKEISKAQKDLTSEVLNLKKGYIVHGSSINDIEAKEENFYKSLKRLAVKMAETFSEQEKTLNDGLEKIEKRVDKSENIVLEVSEEQAKLTNALNSFATEISSVDAATQQITQNAQPQQTAPAPLRQVTPPSHQTNSVNHFVLENQDSFIYPTNGIHPPMSS